MIDVKNISKKYNNNFILSNVSFTIQKGDSVAIIGKSGVGKSILLKSLIGLVAPDTGTIYIDNKLINSMNFKQLQKIRSRIGMVFQFGALFDSFTVADNIGLALKKLTNLNEGEIKTKIASVLKDVDMEGTEDRMPSELSGGMKKRIGIARAIAINPDYLFYDEPTTGLDPIMTDSINRLITKFQNNNQKNVTSIIVTHEMKTVNNVVNRVIMLNEGSIIYDGIPKNINKSEKLLVQQFVKGDSTLI